MDPNNLVLDISSDEDADWNDLKPVSDGGDDYNWFAELFGEVNKESDGGDDDEVVVVVSDQKDVKKMKVKSVVAELDDDCVVLDGDPNELVEVKSDKLANDDDDDDDDDGDEIVVVGEKGQVACRDYPHSRHLCIKFPFSTTPNQSHCNQCYCYVCDSLAPCVHWGNGTATTDHCHATDKDDFWILERKNAKNGGKIVQTPPVDLPAPVLAQPPNQILNTGLLHAQHALANLQYRNNVLASRNKLHTGLASQIVLKAHQKYNHGSRVHRPVFKRTGAVRFGTTANQNIHSPYRGNFGNSISRQQSYQANGMLSRSSKPVGSLQSNVVNPFVRYPSQVPTSTSSTVNPQVFNHSNPNLQSHVNSNPFYQQLHPLPPLSFRPQTTSSQPSYTVPAQPSYPVPSMTRVDSPVVPVSDFTHSSLQGNQAQGPNPIVDSGIKDYGVGWFPGHDSATLECTVPTNNSSSAAVAGGLADCQYDWLFDDQPIEPGFTDYSSDSAFIDTGPIFNF
ncbi:hypothetical protein QVD17_15428 [Tagetes erecta]|uniref:Uncharacterized protein n=1 Tax=Tagetes erecta TaxID=13708 RepID=A0AAD8KP80_TARER|nr:hypothetical protein QVD17_15428 [Tagetes erecta]